MHLQLRHKTPMRRVSAKVRKDRRTAAAPNTARAVDFLPERLFDIRRIHILPVIDAQPSVICDRRPANPLRRCLHSPRRSALLIFPSMKPPPGNLDLPRQLTGSVIQCGRLQYKGDHGNTILFLILRNICSVLVVLKPIGSLASELDFKFFRSALEAALVTLAGKPKSAVTTTLCDLTQARSPTLILQRRP